MYFHLQESALLHIKSITYLNYLLANIFISESYKTSITEVKVMVFRCAPKIYPKLKPVTC